MTKEEVYKMQGNCLRLSLPKNLKANLLQGQDHLLEKGKKLVLSSTKEKRRTLTNLEKVAKKSLKWASISLNLCHLIQTLNHLLNLPPLSLILETKGICLIHSEWPHPMLKALQALNLEVLRVISQALTKRKQLSLVKLVGKTNSGVNQTKNNSLLRCRKLLLKKQVEAMK
jgi:hypothetical protein